MFQITEETKEQAVEAMSKVLFDIDPDAQLTKENLGEAFDAAVKIVMAQFGL